MVLQEGILVREDMVWSCYTVRLEKKYQKASV